jgi:hypothetical protein
VIEPKTSNWVPTIDRVRVDSLQGNCWPDKWIGQYTLLRCTALEDLSGIEWKGWNPDWSAIYAGNEVTLAVDDNVAKASDLAMGETFVLKVDLRVTKGQPFAIRLTSTMFRTADPLDPRERAVIMSSLGAIPAGVSS